MKSKFPALRVLGSEVNIVDPSDVVNCMRQWIEEPDGQCHRITVTGFHGLWEAYRDPRLRSILNSADLWIADGIAPVLVARLQGIRPMPRIPGAELMDAFFHVANRASYRSFFYGDTDETLARLRHTLERRYPGHGVCGTYSPPFRPLTSREDDEIVQMINDAGPDVVWVGLGLPKQDEWIFQHKDRLRAPVAIGVGAAFRFQAGIVKRVPKAVGDLGLEWLWRFAMEPRKLWRRDIIAGPQFLFHVALELLGLKKGAATLECDGPALLDRPSDAERCLRLRAAQNSIARRIADWRSPRDHEKVRTDRRRRRVHRRPPCRTSEEGKSLGSGRGGEGA